MNKTAPHYLLFTEAKTSSPSSGHCNRWRFVLEEIGTSNRFEEADEEPGIQGERLQLLAVVRGLEALEQPSRVTLVTPSKHVGRGIRRSLTLWRENDWQWERFGGMAPVKDHDLWKRIDHAMQIHQINCRVWQFDPPHVRTQVPQESDQEEMVQAGSRFVSPLSNPVNESVRRSECKSESKSESFSTKESKTLPHSDRETPVASVATAPPATLSPTPTSSPVPIESHRLDLRQSRPAIEATIDQLSKVADIVEKNVKPIGQGRAYGYAIN